MTVLGQIVYQPPQPVTGYPDFPVNSVLTYGDSKTVSGLWQAELATSVPALSFVVVTPEPAILGVLARTGSTVASMKALVDSDLAAIDRTIPVKIVLLNLGANETGSMPVEATWIANAQYILDAMFQKWPGVKVYFMRPWVRTKLAECNTIAGWIDTVVASRHFAYLGPDERVWLEGGDDGATMTSDGIHYSAAGDTEAAAQWQAVLGY